MDNQIDFRGCAFKHQPFSGLKMASVSLGCNKNRIDTEKILGCLSGLGISLTDDYQAADLIMVNTCGFIESAQEESINTLLEMAAVKKNQKPVLFAAGCLVEKIGTGIINIIPEIDGAIGVHSYQHLEQFIAMLLKKYRVSIKRNAGEVNVLSSKRILSTSVHSVNIKIAEGCNNRCGYCLIPKIRGNYRSRNPQDIISEIEYFLDSGAREISLIAQDTTAYGSDNPNFPDFAGLISKILAIKKFFWLRLMYTYPSRITDDLIRLIAEDSRICNYLDLPVQHASSKVLAKMGRHYDHKDLEILLIKLQKELPGISLRTTCMVGYPGEGTREFQELLAFIKQYKFEHLGSFIYSRQPETIAGQLAPTTAPRVVRQRQHRLMILQQRISYQRNLNRIGTKEIVLIDRQLSSTGNWYFGRTRSEAPEVDGGVYIFSKTPLQAGNFVTARIVSAKPYNLIALKLQTIDQLTEDEVT